MNHPTEVETAGASVDLRPSPCWVNAGSGGGRGLTYRKHARAPAGTVGKAVWLGKWAALRKPHGLGSTCEARSTQRERLGLQEAETQTPLARTWGNQMDNPTHKGQQSPLVVSELSPGSRPISLQA